MGNLDKSEVKNCLGCIGIFAVIVLISLAYIYAEGWIKQYLPKKVEPKWYVYACPKPDDSSKCYRVKAEITDGRDNEGWWFVNKIYFDNGGSIEFIDCYFEQGKKKGECKENNTDKNWFMEITDEKVKE